MNSDKVTQFMRKYNVYSYTLEQQAIPIGSTSSFAHVSVHAKCTLTIDSDSFFRLIEADSGKDTEFEQREKYPAVKEAYEKYQMLLSLTKEPNE